MTASQRFLQKYRLRHRKDFSRVYARRRASADNVLIVYGCENDLPHARLGLSVSRKVGGAVCRNRWKRLIREAFRCQYDKIPNGIDWVVIPRPDVEPNRALVSQSLLELTSRIAKRLKPK